MKWEIIFFETSREDRPVEKFFKKQRPQAQAKMGRLIDLLEKYGSILGMPHAKMLGGGLYELRVRGKEEIRIVYFFQKQNIYLLHAFKKQTQKTPKKELEIAAQRQKSLT